jgi:hypothetical protein
MEHKMTGPEHFRRAEELAAEAHELLGQGDGQATAGAWAAVAQTHAVLALAATAVTNSAASVVRLNHADRAEHASAMIRAGPVRVFIARKVLLVIAVPAGSQTIFVRGDDL